MILCLDLGTRMGWAARMDENHVLSGTESFALKSGDRNGVRYQHMREWLERHAVAAEAIYYEEVRRHLGTAAAHAYGGYEAVLQAFCEDMDIDYHAVPVGTIKKMATGKGNATKGLMVRAAEEHFHKTVHDDNEADALCLLYTVEQQDG